MLTYHTCTADAPTAMGTMHYYRTFSNRAYLIVSKVLHCMSRTDREKGDYLGKSLACKSSLYKAVSHLHTYIDHHQTEENTIST